MSEGALITERPEVEALAEEWERLAVEASNPLTTAAWTLAWWRHVAPAELKARVVVLRDGGRLVGVAPFFLAERRGGVAVHSLMGADFGVPLGPLALPGREEDLAAETGRWLSQADPPAGALAFGPMLLEPPWAQALRSAWPSRRRPLVCHLRREQAPAIELREDSYEEWLATLNRKLRRDMARSARRFKEEGGTFRWSDAGTLRADAEAFARLHSVRWQGKGWSRLTDLGERLPIWLEDLFRPLIERGRFGLGVLEIDGEPICVDISLSAGRRVEGVNVGWDERFARFGPAKLTLLHVVANAYENGCEVVGLGQGSTTHKVRIANAEEQVTWTTVLPPGRPMPIAYAQLAPALARMHVREGIQRLPEPWALRVKAGAARLRSR